MRTHRGSRAVAVLWIRKRSSSTSKTTSALVPAEYAMQRGEPLLAVEKELRNRHRPSPKIWMLAGAARPPHRDATRPC